MLKAIIVILILPIFFLTFFASPTFALVDEEEGTYNKILETPNRGFESWVTNYEGYFVPEEWKILRAKNPTNNIRRSTDAYLGTYSLRLTNASMGSDIFYIYPDPALSLNVKLKTRVKALETQTPSSGTIALYTNSLGEICRFGFTIVPGITNWTAQKTTCRLPEDFKKVGKVYITLESNVHKPLLIDNVKLVQLPN